MEHQEAQRLMATERYLLGELAPEIREPFEEHLFACRECALDVRAAAAFIDQAKLELGRKSPVDEMPKAARSRGKWWNAWLRPAIAVPAFAVLLAFVAYQNFAVLPGLHQQAAWAQTPRVLASVSLMGANTRGGSTPAVTVHPDAPFLLFLDIPPDSRSSSYIAKLYGPTGALQWSLPITASAASDTVSLRSPGMNHDPGLYTLVVSSVNAGGTQESAVARYPFELNFQSR